MLDVFGGAVLDIFPDDHKADTEHKFFDPTDETDVLKQAMQFAEKYDREHYQS